MTDRTGELLPELQNYTLPGMNLGGNFIYPNYGGRSILNIPATVCNLLGVPGPGIAGPLDPQSLQGLDGPYRQVILIVMDALALHRFHQWTQEGPASIWRRLEADGLLLPLTSITPSTTSAALTALWTGRSAAEHGITGYEMWMKEYGIMVNTIFQSPIAFSNAAGSLKQAGFQPESYLPFPTLGTHLAAHKIPTYVFQHQNLLNSGLSQMLFRDTRIRAFSTSTDLWINLAEHLESRQAERSFNYVYWSEVDGFSHRYGPDNLRPQAEFASFSHALEHNLLARLSPQARRGALLLLAADHGMIETRPDPYYDLGSYPSLTRRLHIYPSGENRLAYFFVKPGQTEAVRETIDRTWPNQFTVLDPAYAVEAGLFGPGDPHPMLQDRLGDFILVAREQAYLWWARKENILHGRHGGLHPQEMLVPFLAAPL